MNRLKRWFVGLAIDAIETVLDDALYIALEQVYKRAMIQREMRQLTKSEVKAVRHFLEIEKEELSDELMEQVRQRLQ